MMDMRNPMDVLVLCCFGFKLLFALTCLSESLSMSDVLILKQPQRKSGMFFWARSIAPSPGTAPFALTYCGWTKSCTTLKP